MNIVLVLCWGTIVPGWARQLDSLPATTHLTHGCWAEGFIDCFPDAAPVFSVRRGDHAVVIGGILHLQEGEPSNHGSVGQGRLQGTRFSILEAQHPNQARQSSCQLLWQLPLPSCCVRRLLPSHLTASRTA